LIKIDDKRIMFDCGLHMMYNDNRRFPDFNFLLKKFNAQSIDTLIDLVVITHFHLDHIGSLPYLTEMFKYTGPILMSFPTRALMPYMLEDFRKVFLDTISKMDEAQQ